MVSKDAKEGITAQLPLDRAGLSLLVGIRFQELLYKGQLGAQSMALP